MRWCGGRFLTSPAPPAFRVKRSGGGSNTCAAYLEILQVHNAGVVTTKPEADFSAVQRFAVFSAVGPIMDRLPIHPYAEPRPLFDGFHTVSSFSLQDRVGFDVVDKVKTAVAPDVRALVVSSVCLRPRCLWRRGKRRRFHDYY